jgi:hypothetical protein
MSKILTGLSCRQVFKKPLRRSGRFRLLLKSASKVLRRRLAESSGPGQKTGRVRAGRIAAKLCPAGAGQAVFNKFLESPPAARKFSQDPVRPNNLISKV